MFSMRFNARLDTSHHGPSHPFKDAGVVADSLTDIHNVMIIKFKQAESPNTEAMNLPSAHHGSLTYIVTFSFNLLLRFPYQNSTLISHRSNQSYMHRQLPS
jgi:hypothetical protein